MDPITLIGLIGSITSIVSFLKKEGRDTDAEDVANRVIAASERTVAEGQLIRKTTILDRVSHQEVVALSQTVISIDAIDDAFMNRIREKCIAKYLEAIADNSVPDADLDEEYEATRRCVCNNVNFARRTSPNGKFPSDGFRDLFERFNCAQLK